MLESLTRGPQGRKAIAILAGAGGACVVAGATLPWLTVFHGLDSYRGTAGMNGRLLAAGGAAAVLLGLWYVVRGATLVRYAIGGLGFALALFSVYITAQLLSVYKALHGMFLPALGPGVFVATAGALLILSTLLVTPKATLQPKQRSAELQRLDAQAVTLLSLSAAAGTIHLTVAADHFAEYFLFGLFFVVVGVAQVAWSALVAINGLSRPLLILAIPNALVVGLWILSRTSGVPIGPSSSTPEAVGFADAVTTGFEIVLIGSAVWLLMRRRPLPTMQTRALWALPLTIAPTTVIAVLSAVGAIGFLPATS
jgi:hypothetical protein